MLDVCRQESRQLQSMNAFLILAPYQKKFALADVLYKEMSGDYA